MHDLVDEFLPQISKYGSNIPAFSIEFQESYGTLHFKTGWNEGLVSN